jgi:transcriptional regulator with XRE-family HTH domain
MRRSPVASPFPTVGPITLPASALPRKADALPARSESASMIGAQVRTLRIAAGESGGRLAARSGVSRSMLSRIERGLASPSVETLERVADALGVPVSRFFGEQGSRAGFCHVRAGRGIMVDRPGTNPGYRHELLGHLLPGSLVVEPYMVTLLEEAEPCTSLQQAGLKFVHMVSGGVRYRYGSKVVDVGAGDSLLFEAAAPHGVETIVVGPVAFLSVTFALRD